MDAATTYGYDAQDRRVSKTAGGSVTAFIYDREGHIILTNPPTPALIETYAAGLHLGTYILNSAKTDTIFYYNHSDWLGTERARIDLSGSVCETITSLPFGDGQTMSGPCVDISPMHFTGKERDTESGLDNFGARYNASTMGRFMTPDPLPWLDWQSGSDRAQRRFQAYINNPQNFNMYAYVRNNPINLTDPTGMYICKGNNTQCAAIQAGLDKAKEALKNGNLNKQQKAALQKVIGFYGKAGDANGVVVQFGKTGAGTGGNTDSSKAFNANITTITFNPSKFAGLSTLQQGEEEVHEGVHGENGVERGGRNPANKTEELATERNAYRTQSYVPQGLGVADGGWGLWDPTWPGDQAEGDRNRAVESDAQKSTAAWCAAGGDCQ